MSPVRVLVVDDSATMRGLIGATLRRDPGLEVVGFAADPHEARAAIKALNPDVITLDIEMPNMNGLEFLEKIMRLRPMPVVMLSTLTVAGADATLRSLELGAVDCVAKPTGLGQTGEGLNDLAERVKAAAGARVRPVGSPGALRAAPASYRSNGRMLAIGSSTGGVEALLTIISQFPRDCPPTVITQHMPATFTPSFAARLDRCTEASVAEARDGAPIEQGRIWLAPGGATHLEVAGTTTPRCRLTDADPVNGHRPSVDVLFRSAAAARERAVGVILTGMGRDGAEGLGEMRKAGARTLGQDADSCVVYGMPRVAFEYGAVERQISLDRMATAILDLCREGG